MRRRKRSGKRAEGARPEVYPVSNETAPTIRKGIYLSALVYIEGEQAAPKDFAALASSTLKEALAQAFKEEREGLRMSLKRIDVRNDVEQEDDTEERFQF